MLYKLFKRMKNILRKTLLLTFLYLMLGVIVFQQPTYGQKPKSKSTIQEKASSKKLQITQEMIEAAQKQEFPWLATVLKKLKANKKININQADPHDDLDNNALYQATQLGNTDIVQILLDKGANIEAKTKYGHTPLHIASAQGGTEIIQLLLSKNANKEAKDKNRSTPLHIAVWYGNTPIVKLLLDQGVDIEAKMNLGDISSEVLEIQRIIDELDKLFLIKEDQIEEGNWGTPLYIAVLKGYPDIVKLLLHQGADIEVKNGFYWRTALHLAVKNGNEPLVRLLLGNNANIESKDRDMLTPLYRAASAGHKSIVRLLLDQGAKVDAKDKYGQISIIMAVQQELDKTSDPATKNSYQAIIEMLQHAMNHK